MLNRVCLSVAFLIAIPAWCQDESAAQPSPTVAYDTRMQVPPPVSGVPYPDTVGAEGRSNYLSATVSLSGGYIDNLYPSGGALLNEATYSIHPAISLDQTTPRQHRTTSYSLGYTSYQPSSVLSALDQTANADYQYRVTPHVALRAGGAYSKISNVFDGSAGSVTGSSLPSTPGPVVPIANQITSGANAGLTIQTSLTDMIGSSGLVSSLHYPNPLQTSGLYDSRGGSGSGFYDHRI